MNSDSSDDDSMVVAVEMKLVEPYQTANSDRLQSSAIAVPLELDTRSALAQGKAGRTPATVSSPLVVPLRT